MDSEVLTLLLTARYVGSPAFNSLSADIDTLIGKTSGLAKAGAAISAVGTGITALTVALAIGVGESIKNASKFQNEMNRTWSVLTDGGTNAKDLTGKNFSQLEAQIIQTSDTYGQSADSIAQGSYFIMSALGGMGYKASDVINNQIIPAFGAFVAASGNGLSGAVDWVTGAKQVIHVLGAMHEPITQWANDLGIMTMAENNSALSQTNLVAGLLRFAPSARLFGLNFKQTVGLISAESEAGVYGSRAGTEAASAYRLLFTSPTSLKALTALGITRDQLFKASGKGSGVIDPGVMFGLLQGKLQNISDPAKRMQLAQELFGAVGFRALGPLMQQYASSNLSMAGSPTYYKAIMDKLSGNAFLKMMGVSGSMMTSFAAQVARLGTNFHNFLTLIGGPLITGLTPIIKRLADALQNLNNALLNLGSKYGGGSGGIFTGLSKTLGWLPGAAFGTIGAGAILGPGMQWGGGLLRDWANTQGEAHKRGQEQYDKWLGARDTRITGMRNMLDARLASYDQSMQSRLANYEQDAATRLANFDQDAVSRIGRLNQQHIDKLALFDQTAQERGAFTAEANKERVQSQRAILAQRLRFFNERIALAQQAGRSGRGAETADQIRQRLLAPRSAYENTLGQQRIDYLLKHGLIKKTTSGVISQRGPDPALQKALYDLYHGSASNKGLASRRAWDYVNANWKSIGQAYGFGPKAGPDAKKLLEDMVNAGGGGSGNGNPASRIQGLLLSRKQALQRGRLLISQGEKADLMREAQTTQHLARLRADLDNELRGKTGQAAQDLLQRRTQIDQMISEHRKQLETMLGEHRSQLVKSGEQSIENAVLGAEQHKPEVPPTAWKMAREFMANTGKRIWGFGKKFGPLHLASEGLWAGVRGIESAPAVAKKALGFVAHLPQNFLKGLTKLPGLIGDIGSKALLAIPQILGIGSALIPIIGVALLVAGAVTVLVLIFLRFRKEAEQVGQALLKGLAPIFKWMMGVIIATLHAVGKAWDAHKKQIDAAIKGLLQAFKAALPFFQVVFGIIAGVIAVVVRVIGYLVGAFIDALPHIIAIFSAIFKILGDLGRIVMDVIHGDWGKAWQDAQTLLSHAWEGIQQLVGMLWSFIVGVFSRLWSDIGPTLTGIWQAVMRFFSNLPAGIGSFMASIGNATQTVFTSLGPKVQTALTSLWNGTISPFFASLPGKISGLATSGVNNLWTALFGGGGGGSPRKTANSSKPIVTVHPKTGEIIVGGGRPVHVGRALLGASAHGGSSGGSSKGPSKGSSGGILPGIVSFFQNLGPKILPAVGNFTGFFVNIWKTLGPQILPALGRFFGGIFTASINFWKTLGPKILPALGNFIGFFLNIWKILLTRVLPALGKFFGGIFTASLNFWKTLGPKILPAIGNFMGFFLNLWKMLFTKLIPFLNHLWNSKVIPFFNSLPSKITKKLDQLKKQWDHFWSVTFPKKIQPALEDLWKKHVQPFFQSLPGKIGNLLLLVLSKMRDFWKSIGPKIMPFVWMLLKNYIGPFFLHLPGYIFELLLFIIPKFWDFFRMLGRVMDAIWGWLWANVFLPFLKSLPGKIMSAIKSLNGLMVDFFKKLGQNAVSAFGNALGGLGGVFKNAISRIPGGSAMAKMLHIPGFAKGGDVLHRTLAMVGEKGPELVALPGGAHVYPHDQTTAMMRPLGGGSKMLQLRVASLHVDNLHGLEHLGQEKQPPGKTQRTPAEEYLFTREIQRQRESVWDRYPNTSRNFDNTYRRAYQYYG